MERRINGFGIGIGIPPGWDGRIFRRQPQDASASTNPVTHIGNFALPINAGDFGNGAYTIMGPNGIFLSLVEYDPAQASDPLFAALQQIPTNIDGSCFNPNAMPVVVSGMAGRQFFFTVAKRAFCAFAVIGDYTRRDLLAAQLNPVMAGLQIAPR
jgi:hypothetical protein